MSDGTGSNNYVKAPSEEILSDEEAEERIRRMSRRSFLSGAVGVAIAGVGWWWLKELKPAGQAAQDLGDVAWPFRRALETNAKLSQAYFRETRPVPTFPRSMAGEPRGNATVVPDPDEFDPDTWKLALVGLKDMSKATKIDETDPDEKPAVRLTLDAIKAFPKVDMTVQLKCIEGWADVVNWGGTPFRDFLLKYPPPTKSGKPIDLENGLDDLPQYVGFVTPSGEYYVGIDMASAIHPQTLLCYEMNGEPLPLNHGAPLRLAIPIKYGIKNLQRIGTITYTDERPKDYWAERGYDYYAGH
ncbi:MAG: molybdopterin-binding oxidoreductase [Chthonomonadaceae bacterium]|nr:molybdopterin-binding oxidoreductase [Chthonomonadaceae bacterium]